MPGLPVALEEAVERCRSRIDEHWGDVDTDDDEAVKVSSPMWHLVRSVGEGGPEDLTYLRLSHLSLFAARRALACWDLYCDGSDPRLAVEALLRWIDGDRGVADAEWEKFSDVAVPVYRGKPITDCRYCDTSCAAEAAAHAARFVRSGDIEDAYRCVVYADTAFDQSPLVEEDHFRHWLLDFAVPAAFEMRELAPVDREALREYDASELAALRDQSSEE